MSLLTMPIRLTTIVIVSLLMSCTDSAADSVPSPATAGAGLSGAGGTNTASAGVSGGTAGAGTAAGATASAGTSGGATGVDTGIPATFETLKLVLGGGGGIMPCSAAPCHGVNGVAPPDHPLELPPNDDRQLYAILTSYVSRACNGKKLVVAGDPAASALITILEGPCGMTPRMPYGCSAEAGDCIPADYIAAVARWIASGAPQP